MNRAGCQSLERKQNYQGKNIKMTMRIQNFHLLLCILVLWNASSFLIHAAEDGESQIIIEDASDLVFINGLNRNLENFIVDGQKIIRRKGVANFRSREKMQVAPDKIYRVSGQFKLSRGSSPARIYMGVIPYDGTGRRIESKEVTVVPGTDTILAEKASVGDQMLTVKNAAKWKTGGQYIVAFHTNEKYSDLPNKLLSDSVTKVIKQKNGNYQLILKNALTAEYKAGTKIRQHRYASTYAYAAAGNVPLTQEWKECSGIIRGRALHGGSFQKWWPGTAYAAIVLLVNAGGNAESVTLMKNLKLEELTR